MREALGGELPDQRASGSERFRIREVPDQRDSGLEKFRIKTVLDFEGS